jgi:probable HAF family extracellular repeat protein
VFWSGGAVHDLGTLPGDRGSEATAINNSGQVVGSSSGPSGIRAVLWTRSGEIQRLGTLPGGRYSQALAINDRGAVVGISGSTLGTRAFLWTAAGGVQDLNGLIPAGAGLVLSAALGINNLGQIVAIGHDDQGLGGHDEHEHNHELPLRVLLLVP